LAIALARRASIEHRALTTLPGMRPAAALHGRARASGKALTHSAWPAARSRRARPPPAGRTAGERVHRDVQAPAAEVEAHLHRDLLAQRGLRAAPDQARPLPVVHELCRPCTVWQAPCHAARNFCKCLRVVTRRKRGRGVSSAAAPAARYRSGRPAWRRRAACRARAARAAAAPGRRAATRARAGAPVSAG